MPTRQSEVIIVGAGIGGLTLGLALHAAGISFRIFEASPKLEALGVGLNLLPHAVRELSGLGLDDSALAGIHTREYCYFTRNGQIVYREPRGRFAGYRWPQISIHRGDLQLALVKALIERAGRQVLVLGHKCVRVDQNESAAFVQFQNPVTGEPLPTAKGSVAIACDGVHSVARVQMHPREAVPRYEGTMQYRGTSLWEPFLSGASMIYLGTHETGKLIMYPIKNDVEGDGRQLINWVIEITRPTAVLLRDWSRKSRVEEFIDDFSPCVFDWLDIPAVLRAAQVVYEYPMIDQDPLSFWTDGRITLLGDAAHPMMPRGSNGAAQAIIDATTLAALLASGCSAIDALKEYEAKRLAATSEVVLANRNISPDAILRVVEERTSGRRFEHVEDVISRDELEQWQARYRKVAGFSTEDVNQVSVNARIP